MGLTAGLVPPRVDGNVKAGLLALIEHASEQGGWSLRRSSGALGIDHVRVLRWQARAAAGQLDDRRRGPDQVAHALLGWEREAVCELAGEWGETGRPHRKLAHRGSRLAIVHASEPAVLRVLTEAGVHVPAAPPREPRPARSWPAWAELVRGVIWIYDFTNFTRAKRCAVAVLDVVSRYWLATVVSAEESSTQAEVAFTRALIADGKEHLLDDGLLAELASGEIPEGATGCRYWSPSATTGRR